MFDDLDVTRLLMALTMELLLLKLEDDDSLGVFNWDWFPAELGGKNCTEELSFDRYTGDKGTEELFDLTRPVCNATFINTDFLCVE